jgi:HEAT repeat protein
MRSHPGLLAWLAGVLALAGGCGSAPKPPDPNALIEKLKSADPEVSGTASLEIVRLGEPAVPALVALLQDPDPKMRTLAASTFWGMGAKAREAAPALGAALADPETGVRVKVAMALENMGAAAEAAIPDLVKALRDRDGQVRQWAARALGSIGPAAESAVPALAKAAKAESVMGPAEEAIRKIRGGTSAESTPSP